MHERIEKVLATAPPEELEADTQLEALCERLAGKYRGHAKPGEVAQSDEENRQALEDSAMFGMKQGGNWDNWSNDDFIALCHEPEVLADMTPLERELLARLAGAWGWSITLMQGLKINLK